MKTFLAFLIIFLSFSVHAIEKNACYRLNITNSQDPGIFDHDAFFCAFTVIGPKTGKSLNGFSLIFNEKGAPISDASPIFRVAANFVDFQKKGLRTDVGSYNYRFSFEQSNPNVDEGKATLYEQITADYQRTDPALTTELMSLIKNKSDDECPVYEVGLGKPLQKVLDAKQIPLDFSHTDLKPQNLKASLELKCEQDFDIGPFQREHLTCEGSPLKMNIEVTADGQLKIPKIFPMKGLVANDLNSYQMTIEVTNELSDSIFSIHVYGERTFKNLNRFNGKFYFTQFSGGTIPVYYNGQDLFKTELIKQNNANLSISIEPAHSQASQDFDYSFQFHGSLNWEHLGGNNSSITAEPNKLKNQTSIIAPPIYIVTLDRPEVSWLSFRASYASDYGAAESAVEAKIHMNMHFSDVIKGMPLLNLVDEK
jgi:hypothetical protein